MLFRETRTALWVFNREKLNSLIKINKRKVGIVRTKTLNLLRYNKDEIRIIWRFNSTFQAIKKWNWKFNWINQLL